MISPHYNVRLWLEEREEGLSPHAQKSRSSLGRLKPEDPCPMRTAFQRDRDRIIHCKAFRRLKHKTQVFIAPLGDHYVTRLTHTLELAQIARSIARSLNLNEDLAEAISLGHDLGHTPFGHVGEEVLDEISPSGFRHNEQSLRVVDLLEAEGKGLNLTLEVREGILKHSKSRGEIMGKDWDDPETLEAQVCKLADVITYVNHDLDDALRAGVIHERDLPDSVLPCLGGTRSKRINAFISDVLVNSWAARGESIGLDAPPLIRMSQTMNESLNTLREFLFDQVYHSAEVEREAGKARAIIYLLYEYFTKNEDKLPGSNQCGDTVPARVVDYIAGMTDQYALHVATDAGLYP